MHPWRTPRNWPRPHLKANTRTGRNWSTNPVDPFSAVGCLVAPLLVPVALAFVSFPREHFRLRATCSLNQVHEVPCCLTICLTLKCDIQIRGRSQRMQQCPKGEPLTAVFGQDRGRPSCARCRRLELPVGLMPDLKCRSSGGSDHPNSSARLMREQRELALSSQTPSFQPLRALRPNARFPPIADVSVRVGFRRVLANRCATVMKQCRLIDVWPPVRRTGMGACNASVA